MNLVLRVFFDHVWRGQDRHPSSLFLGWCLESIHTKAAWETRHTAKHGFETLSQVVRNKIFVHLDFGDPTAAFVFYSSFAAESHDIVVVHDAIHQE
jgi:hypothetical protein